MLVFPFFGGSKRKPERPAEKPAERQEGGCSVLSVIVPAYNEESNIRGALKRQVQFTLSCLENIYSFVRKSVFLTSCPRRDMLSKAAAVV